MQKVSVMARPNLVEMCSVNIKLIMILLYKSINNIPTAYKFFLGMIFMA